MDIHAALLLVHFESRFLSALASNPAKLAKERALHDRACRVLEARLERLNAVSRRR